MNFSSLYTELGLLLSTIVLNDIVANCKALVFSIILISLRSCAVSPLFGALSQNGLVCAWHLCNISHMLDRVPFFKMNVFMHISSILYFA